MAKQSVWARIAVYYFGAYLLTGIFALLQGQLRISEQVIQLPQLGPALAALTLVTLEGKSAATLLRNSFRFRLDSFTIIMVLMPAVLTSLVSFLTTRLWGVDNLGTNISISFVLSTVVAATCEEIGWRGYMLPRLQSRMSAVGSSVVLGVMWGLWHVPKLLMGFRYFAFWLIGTVGLTFVLTVVFNRTGGNLLAVSLIHSSTNLAAYFALQGFADHRVILVYSISYALWALALVSVGKRQRWLTRPPATA